VKRSPWLAPAFLKYKEYTRRRFSSFNSKYWSEADIHWWKIKKKKKVIKI
jgi:hypothetical protein